MEPRTVALGWVLLFLSSLMLIDTGVVGSPGPLYAAAAASLALAIGSALAGVRRQHRPA